MLTRLKNLKVRKVAVFVLIPMSVLYVIPDEVRAGCDVALKLLGDALKQTTLDDQQIQAIGGYFFWARGECFAGEEIKSMQLINKIRSIANLGVSSEEFDWENVPLRSLEEQE